MSAGDILKEPADPEQRSALSEAKDFLIEELAEGPMAAEQVRKDARATGVSERTLKRAKRNLGVRSEKEGDGSWIWVLPEREVEEGQAPSAGTLGTVGTLGKGANPRSDSAAYLREEGQGGQEGQEDQRRECDHGYADG